MFEFAKPDGIEWTLFWVSLAIVLAPIAAERLRLPGLIGLIAAGFILGPFGLDIVDVGSLDTLGEIGLVFLMFMAGLELDMNLFNRYRRAAVGFGITTFLLPFALGGIAAAFLDYETAAAILIGSIWASHTLVAYPALRKLDVVDNPAIATAVGATVITDTIALVILAIIVGTETGDESGAELALKLGVGLGLLVLTCFVFLPWISQVVFTGIGRERTLRFVWLVAALMGAAALAEFVEIETIVGAFFAGLGLNRLVPNRSELMERTEFFASALFIPMFLISVGDKIDPEVIADLETLGYAAIFLGAVVIGKATAAWLAGRAYHFSAAEVGAMFSLSVAQAAATLAATIVGVEAGILDEQFLNAAIVVVAATLFIASVTAERFGRRLPTSAASESRLGDVVIVPVLPGVELEPLIAVAALIAAADGGVVRPIEVSEGQMTPDARRKRAEEIRRLASAHGIDCEPIVRVDSSVEEGLRHATIQYDGTMVLMPPRERGVIPSFFRQDDTMGLARTLPVPVALTSAAAATMPQRVIVAFDRHDLGPAQDSARSATLEIARHIAASGIQTQIVIEGSGTVHGAESQGLTVESAPSGIQAWITEQGKPGDIVVVPASADTASFSSRDRAIASMPGFSVLRVSPPSGQPSGPSDPDHAARVAIGRSM